MRFLLDAILGPDSRAVVMHVRGKPYVFTSSDASGECRGPLAWCRVELSSCVLAVEAVTAMGGAVERYA